MRKISGSSTLLLAVMVLSLALFLPALQSGVGGGGQSNIGGGGGVTFPLLPPTGGVGFPAYSFSGANTSGFYFNTLSGPAVAINSTDAMGWSQTRVMMTSAIGLGWQNAPTTLTGITLDTGFSRGAAGVITVDTSTIGNALGTIKPGLYATGTNCSSSASPAVCAAAAAGSVAVAAAATTEVVNTTAVTANSQILLTRDDSLGTKLGVTCNTATVMGEMKVSARTGGTSFTITVQTAPVTNPGCVSYSIIN